MRIVLILLLTFWDGGEGYAQINLVPNWSFEEYNSCPNTYSPDCNSNPFLPTVKDWYCTFDVYSSPDYFNGCSTLNYNFKNVKGFQKPRTGLGYVGGLMNVLSNQLFDNIEYIQCTLRDSLKPNVNYCVQFFVSRTSFSAFALSQYGAVFTNNRLLLNGSGSPKFINLVPQVKNPLGSFIKDTLNWTKVEGSFLSTGSEHFMTLGCFGTQSLTDTLYDQLTTNPNDRYYPPYYYLDDVSVELVTKAQAGRDTVINCGGIASLGADSAIGATYKWFSKTGLNFDTVAFPLATPTITTKYVLQKTQCHIITYDTVKVTVTNTCPYINTVDEFIIPNVFTPNGDGVNDAWEFSLGFGNIITDFNVYNRWGNIIQTTSLKNQTTMLWDGHTTSGEECSGGVYFYTLQYTNVLGEQKKVNGYVTLIK
ncbi:MAG: gliding motility-associated C-terminal domain-containing protein [Bacteroidia bacterium]|nr:gliding motility-associated C-terminal domain-containing protein [Bacteroidia bacterium]